MLPSLDVASVADSSTNNLPSGGGGLSTSIGSTRHKRSVNHHQLLQQDQSTSLKDRLAMLKKSKQAGASVGSTEQPTPPNQEDGVPLEAFRSTGNF